MQTDRRSNSYRLTIEVYLALGIIVPRMFHVFGTPGIGKVFLPMHFSIFIAGIFLGPFYGTIIGFITPLINSLFGMPIFPQNIIMAFELASYGLFAGLFMYLLKSYNNKRISRTIRIYISLILSMILGRMVNAIVLLLMARLFNMNVPAPLSVLASSLRGMPGILIQLLLVPGIVIAIYSSQEKYIQ